MRVENSLIVRKTCSVATLRVGGEITKKKKKKQDTLVGTKRKVIGKCSTSKYKFDSTKTRLAHSRIKSNSFPISLYCIYVHVRIQNFLGSLSQTQCTQIYTRHVSVWFSFFLNFSFFSFPSLRMISLLSLCVFKKRRSPTSGVSHRLGFVKRHHHARAEDGEQRHR